MKLSEIVSLQLFCDVEISWTLIVSALFVGRGMEEPLNVFPFNVHELVSVELSAILEELVKSKFWPTQASVEEMSATGISNTVIDCVTESTQPASDSTKSSIWYVPGDAKICSKFKAVDV